MAITIESYERFNSLTNYQLQRFLLSWNDFSTRKFPQIRAFYQGRTKRLNGGLIKELNEYAEEVINVLGLFDTYKNAMTTCDFWELLDIVEDVRTDIQYKINIPKYLRSSLIKGKTEAGYTYEYTRSIQETLEDVDRIQLGNTTFNNTWSEIAIKNDLREVDWEIDQQSELELVNTAFQAGLVTSMIDYTIGDRIYGKDIKKLFEFEDDDLMVLSYKDTVYQTVNILSTLSKNDMPEYPYLGINGDIWKGTNFSKINYPLIFRELEGIFRTDDLFKDFKVRSIDYLEGDLYIEFEVGTKRDLVIINSVTI